MKVIEFKIAVGDSEKWQDARAVWHVVRYFDDDAGAIQEAKEVFSENLTKLFRAKKPVAQKKSKAA